MHWEVSLGTGDYHALAYPQHDSPLIQFQTDSQQLHIPLEIISTGGDSFMRMTDRNSAVNGGGKSLSTSHEMSIPQGKLISMPRGSRAVYKVR